MALKKIIATGAMVTMLSGAAFPAYSSENVLGTLIGAAGGAAIGSNIGKGKGRVAAIAVGTLVGAGIGNSPQSSRGSVYAADYHRNNHRHRGHKFYGHNNRYPAYYSYNTYPSYWVNQAPQAQIVQVNNYQETPAQASQLSEYCREFQQSVTIGNKVQPGYGIACLQPDGSWQIKK